jgi:AraC-like DNA-binding protein
MRHETGIADAVQRVPEPRLRDLVTVYHGYRYTGLAPGVHHGLPSTELTVVIALDEPLDVGWAADESTRGRYWAMTSGLHDRPALIRHHGSQHGIQLGLTPLGARALLGVPAAGLAAALVPLGAVVGPLLEQMYDEIAGARTWRERFEALDRHLVRWTQTPLGPRHGIRDELRWAWSALQRSHGALRVEDLARETGWSRRHLTAQFSGEFGIGPKTAARVMRFQRSRARLLAAPRGGGAQVAAECGYADQAHLSREWRELAGYSPTQWLRAEFPFLQDTVAAG